MSRLEVVAGSEESYYMISSANSMKLGYSQDWSRSGYLSEVNSRNSLRIFYILGYIFQSDWCLVFGILNYRSSLLCSGLSGLSLSSVFWLILRVTLSMQYSGNSIAKLCYQSVLFGIVRRFIQPEVQRMFIFWLLFSQHESPTYSASYLNWYKFRSCPLCVHFTPYRNCEDAIFCKVDGM